MNKEIYNDRKVDNLSVEKSKKYLWKYMKEKKGIGHEAQTSKSSGWLAAFFTPKKFAWAGAIAMLVIITMLVGPNLRNLMQGELTPATPIASAHFTLKVDKEDSTGINPNATFTLASTEDLSAADIEAALEVLPNVDLNVKKIGTKTYKVEPAQDLESNRVYNFTIGTDSWAYQVKNEFKVYSTIPGNESTNAPTNTGIEFNLSHENYDIAQIQNYLEVSPKADFKYEKHNRTFVAIPVGGLQRETVYTVTLKAGLPLENSDKSLASDYSFKFETGTAKGGSQPNLRFIQTDYQIGTEQPVAMYVNFSQRDESPIEEIQLKVYKFKNTDDYISTLEAQNTLPAWSNYARKNYQYDKQNLNYLGEYETKLEQIEYRKFIHAPTANLEVGQYLFEAHYKDTIAKTLVQITDLSSYTNLTKSESLFWINDVSTGKPVKDAKVEFKGKSIKTNAEGIATTDFNFKALDDVLIKVTAPDQKIQILNLNIPSYTKTQSALADYWFSMTTDRPTYQQNDTIEFWGFMKPKQPGTKVDDIKVVLNKGGWFWGERKFTDEVMAEKGSDNTYHGSLKINDLPTGYYTLTVFNGDQVVAEEYVDIRTYNKPTYEIAVEIDKRAMFYDETAEVTIDSRFFDGTPMPNLKLFYNQGNGSNEAQKEIRTDDAGHYEFDYKYESNERPCNYSNCYNSQYKYLTFDPKPKEDTVISGNANIRVFTSKLILDSKTESKNNVATVDITSNHVDLTAFNANENTYHTDVFGDIAPNTLIQGTLTELWWEKHETGEYYDFINKVTRKTYKSTQRTQELDKVEIQTDAEGKATYKFEMKQGRSYRLKLIAKDNDGKETFETAYAYGKAKGENKYYRVKVMNGTENWGPYKFGIGKKVETAVVENDAIVEPDEDGKFLFMQHNNGLTEHSVKSEPTYNFTFGKDQVPGVRVSSVWFNGTAYKEIWGETVQLETSEKAINIEIKPTKGSYEPGDKATLKIKTTDANGKAVSAQVLLDLVDEAYYQLFYDSITNPLNDLYRFSGDGILKTVTTHKNPVMEADTGGKGGCFTALTQILMGDRSYKNIRDIQIGDVILTKESPTSNRLVEAKVLKTHEHKAAQYLVINENLEVTAEHVLFINGRWSVAGKIKEGDILLNKDGGLIEVETVREVVKPTMVYNFEVEYFHTYFANDYYVHNNKGGARSEFKDTALFKAVQTNRSGEAEITFTLPDNITTWRISALAIDGDELRAGRGSGKLQVTLPFFADFVMNNEYSIKDEPHIGLRAFGRNLVASDDVEYKVYAESLGLDESDSLAGKAFKTIDFIMPDLKLGKHEVQVDAIAGKNKDALLEVIEVVGSRLTESKIEFLDSVDENTEIPLPEKGYADVYFMNAGVASYYGDLMHLYYARGQRLDQKLSNVVGKELINEYFELNFGDRREFDVEEYQDPNAGLRLIPHGGSDLKQTALTLAMDTNPKRFNEKSLVNYLNGVYTNKDSNFDEIVLSLLGLAALDEPVLNSLRLIKDDKALVLEQKLYIGLAFAELGSLADAREMYVEVKDSMMQGNAYETALGTVLAASLGEKDDAVELWRFVEKNGIVDDIPNLYLMGYLKHVLKYADPSDVSFTATINDSNKEAKLGKCQTFSALVSAGKGIQLSNIQGDLAAVVHYENLIEPENFVRDESVEITRNYRVNGILTDTFTEGDIVEIELIPFSKDSKTWYRITDVLPSGLKILNSNYSYYATNGQEVYTGWSTQSYKKTIKYYATVVNAGRFYADPAKIESYRDPAVANISAANFVNIRSYVEGIEPEIVELEDKPPFEGLEEVEIIELN